MKVKAVIVFPFVVLLSLAALWTTSADATPIYNIVNSQSNQNGYTVTGQIELKDGTAFGPLSVSNIKSWSWTVSSQSKTFSGSSTSTGAYAQNYTGLSAYATGIYVGDTG